MICLVFSRMITWFSFDSEHCLSNENVCINGRNGICVFAVFSDCLGRTNVSFFSNKVTVNIIHF